MLLSHMNRLTAIIVDDEEHARKALASLVQRRHPDINLLGVANDVPSGIEAYRFTGDAQAALYILWSNTTTQTVPLPATASARVFDRDGIAQPTHTAQGGIVKVEVGVNPIFVVADPQKR